MMKIELREMLQAKFPPEAYKEVKFGRGFTSIDAYHIIERLNTVFGLCGTGWGVEVKEYVVTGDSVAALGHLWYNDGENIGTVCAVGDATVIKGNVAEAYKKALTNLISKASSYIEIGLDVYMGKHDSDPYLDKVYLAEQKKKKGEKDDIF